MANDYYSFWQGDIYEHHSELETPKYNTFYGNSTSSRITVLFNEDPGVVKSVIIYINIAIYTNYFTF